MIPDSSQVSTVDGELPIKESNSVNVRHEYYGSTTVTQQKVITLSVHGPGVLGPCVFGASYFVLCYTAHVA